jgi:hypothetical protein
MVLLVLVRWVVRIERLRWFFFLALGSRKTRLLNGDWAGLDGWNDADALARQTGGDLDVKPTSFNSAHVHFSEIRLTASASFK